MIAKSNEAELIKKITNRIILQTDIEDPQLAMEIARKWARA